MTGMDAAEMEESFDGQQCEDEYHPFKDGGAIGLD